MVGGEYFFRKWAEVVFIIILVIGFVIALVSPSAAISYIVIFICGLFAGRVIYERKGRGMFPYFLIIIGFFIGYLIGAYRGEREVMAVLFVLGGLIGYYIYDKGILRDIRF
ncbi:hypothetical protein KY361_01000 [Candidatus Woesearchaeota archaeon]|nr:hypothetical protein [Candidatus Woesearchaeota archaeon]